MRFLIVAREVVTGCRCVDLCLRQFVHEVDCPQFLGAGILATSFVRPIGVLVSLADYMTDDIYYFSVFEMVSSSCVDAGRSFLNLERS